MSLAVDRKATGVPSWASACAIASRPSAGWDFMISNSSGVKRPGLSRMRSGMPTLPMSCSGADLNSVAMYSGVSSACQRGCPRSACASALT